MKRFVMLLGLVLLASTAAATVPKLINFQGILKDGSGNPVANGPYSVIFTIYDAPAGGSVQWAETTSVTTSSGLFTVLLGSLNPVPDSAFNNPNRWMGVKVGADTEMTPRQQLVSLSYAYRVNSVDSALGGNLIGDLTVSGNVGIGTNAPFAKLSLGTDFANTKVALYDSPADQYGLGIQSNQFRLHLGNINNRFSFLSSASGTELVTIQGSGNVGIGTASPAARLHVHDPTNTSNGSRLTLTQAAGGSTLLDGLALICRVPYGYLWNYENGPSIFGTNNVERMRIDSAGNVGIGIDAPTARLQVGSVGSEGIPPFIAGTMVAAQATNPDNWTHMAIISGSLGQARLNFGDGANDDQGSVGYNNVNDAMFFSTAAAERMRITSAGSVGIGTTTPQGALDVSSTTGAFIVPRMTTAQRNALTAVNGMIIYNTDAVAGGRFEFRENGAWVTK